MNKTFIAISITYYNIPFSGLAPEVHYYRHDGTTPVSTWDELTVDEGNKLMWELVKLGGENSYKSNPFNNAICERKVTFWGTL